MPNTYRGGEGLDGDALEFFFNSGDMIFAILDENGRVIRANIAFRHVTGPASAADNVSIFEFLSSGAAAELRQRMTALTVGAGLTGVALTFRIGRSEVNLLSDITRASASRFYFCGRDQTSQSRLDMARREANSNLSRLEDVAGIGRWRMARNRRSEWSDGMFRMFGLPIEDGPPRFEDFKALLSPEDVIRLKETMNASYRDEKPISIIYKARTPAGEEKLLEMAGSPTLDSEGYVIGLHGVAIDRTDHLTGLKSLMESDNSFRYFLDHAPISAAVVDRSMRVVLANQRYLRDLRLKEEETLGRDLRKLPFRSDSELVADLVDSCARAFQGETTKRSRVPILEDGRRHWLRSAVAPWYDGEGAIGGAILTHENITPMVEALDNLEHSRERVLFGLSMSSMLIWELDLQTGDAFVEGELSDFFNQDGDNLDSKSAVIRLSQVNDIIHAADIDEVTRRWAELMENGVSYRIDHRLVNRSGREIWVRTMAKPIRDDDGKMVRVVGSTRDISSTKQDELRIRAAEAEQRANNAANSEFIARISHEMQDPLEAIVTTTNELTRSGLTAEQERLGRDIAASGRRLLSMMDDILEYARLDAGQVECDIGVFNVRDALSLAVSDHADTIRNNGLRVDLRLTPDAEAVFRGDGARIRKVLSHLLRESVNATWRGRILISADVEDSGEGVALLVLGVRDGAEPTSENHEALLGGVFRRKDGLPLTGAGMSLALAAKLVRLMKGVMKIEAVSDGRMMTLEIPVTRDAPAMPRAPLVLEPDQPGYGLQGRKVLIAEDNPMNRRILALMLEGAEIEHDFVEDGEDAVRAAEEGLYDAIVMDVLMPVMNGVEAAKRIRKMEAESRPGMRTPILALGASLSGLTEADIAEAGFEASLTKPVVAEDLIHQLGELLSSRPRRLSAPG